MQMQRTMTFRTRSELRSRSGARSLGASNAIGCIVFPPGKGCNSLFGCASHSDKRRRGHRPGLESWKMLTATSPIGVSSVDDLGLANGTSSMSASLLEAHRTPYISSLIYIRANTKAHKIVKLLSRNPLVQTLRTPRDRRNCGLASHHDFHASTSLSRRQSIAQSSSWRQT